VTQPCNLWCSRGHARRDEGPQSWGGHGGTRLALMGVVGLTTAAMPRSITLTAKVCWGMLLLTESQNVRGWKGPLWVI